MEGGWGSYKEDWRAARSDAIQMNVNRGKENPPIKTVDMIMNPDVAEQAKEEEKNNTDKIAKARESFRQLSKLSSKKNKKNRVARKNKNG